MKKFIGFFLFLTLSNLLFGEIVLKTSDNKTDLNTPFDIGISFIDEKKIDHEIEGINDFKILSTGSQSNYTINNGKMSSMATVIYTLLPLKEGKFELTGKTAQGKTNSVVITVEKGTGKSQQNPASQSTNNTSSSGLSTIPITGGSNSSTYSSKPVTSDDVTIRTNIKDKGASYYFGEKIPFEEIITSKVSINGYRPYELPGMNDFSVNDITPQNPQGGYTFKRIQTNGQVSALEFLSFQGILEANSYGEKEIKTGSYMFQISSTGRNVNVGPKEIKVNILPLPNNKPNNFQNVVGELKGETTWNKDKINYGESVLLTIKLYGNVNLDSLETIAKNTVSQQDFNIFETIKSSSENVKNGYYYGEKTFEIAFVPKNTGKIKIPKITIPYFDTKTKKYSSFDINEKEIEVMNSTANQQNPSLQNTNTQQPEPLKEETIEINAISENNAVPFYVKHIKVILALLVAEGLLIIGILYKLFSRSRSSSKKSIVSFDNFKNAKNDKEFYDIYCDLMKEKYNFIPKVHLEDRLIKNGGSPALVALNREIEEKIYSDSPLDKNKIISVLKKEIK